MARRSPLASPSLILQAALLLPLAAANLGLAPGAAWAKPPPPSSTPVAQRTTPP